jgi:Amt family ammonium transporter
VTPGQLEASANLAWVLVAGFLVMFMQAGFAMVETGFTRSKNAVNTVAMNFLIYPIGMLGFWLCGYAIMMGGVATWPSLGPSAVSAKELAVTLGGHRFGLLGWSKFALVSVSQHPASLAMFLFSSLFMDTAATIPTGAMAERWRFPSFVVYGVFISTLLYPIYGNWVWGGGFLSALGSSFGLGHGHVDFAGATVVHMTGGVTGLAGAILLGPRAGKFRRDGTVSQMPGHNLPMAVVGTLVLGFGWFGFNAGSTLASSDARVALVSVNTLLASSAGALAALLYVWQRHGTPDVGMACNGFIGGLVSITGACAFVVPAAAVLIGGLAGLIIVYSVSLLERRFRIDDPVGAVSVHGVCGAWGGIATGLFADGTYGEGWNGVRGPVRGLLYGDASQLVAQLVGVVTNAVVVFGLAFSFFRLIDRIMGNRVSAEVETVGLDALEMGSDAYPHG